MKQTFIGGYWAERIEPIDEAAKKITLFLKEIETISTFFSPLRLLADTKKEAMQNSFNISMENILIQLRKRRKKNEIDENGFCKIGFAIDLFNEIDEKISLNIGCSIGASSKYFKNACYIKITGEVLDVTTQNMILKIIKEIFKPETIKQESLLS